MKHHDVTWEELNPEPYDNTDAMALLREERDLLRTVLTWTERCKCGACQLCAATESYNAWRREHE